MVRDNALHPPGPPEGGGDDPLAPEAIAERIDRWAGHGPQGPVTLELYPTLLCNLDCSFCDTTVRHRPAVDELSADRLLDLIDEAASLGVERVFVLGGGEPLARKDAIEPLLRRIKQRDMQGVLTTNGTLMGPRIARTLLEIGWDEVHVSIDAPDAATHDRLRGREGSFRQAVRHTCRLAVARRRLGRSLPRIALHFVLTRANWRLLPGMVRLAHALGASRIDFDALIAYSPAQLALKLSPDEAARVPAVAREALALARELGISTTLEHLLDPAHVDRGGEGAGASPSPPGLDNAPCLKAWHDLVVQADGRVSPCCVLAGLGGSVADRSLAEAWRDDPFLVEVRRSMEAGQPLERCRECSWNILGHEVAIREALRARRGER